MRLGVLTGYTRLAQRIVALPAIITNGRDTALLPWKALPLKEAAHREVKHAIGNGTLVRPALCSECGSDRHVPISAHHDDYNKPLDVRWLCAVCHKVAHRE